MGVRLYPNKIAPENHASRETKYGISSGEKYGHAKASDEAPFRISNESSSGVSIDFARSDHIHGSDSSVTVGKAEMLLNNRSINGIEFNGTSSVTWYGVCTTSSFIREKFVQLDNFILEEGVSLNVRFTQTNNAANPTLCVNNTEAKPIQFNNNSIELSALKQGHVYTFVFSNDAYQIISGYDDNPSIKNIISESTYLYIQEYVEDITINEGMHKKVIVMTSLASIQLPLIRKNGFHVYIKNLSSSNINITPVGCTVDAIPGVVTLSPKVAIILISNGSTGYISIDTSARFN